MKAGFQRIAALAFALLLLLSLQMPLFASEAEDGGAVILHPEELAAYLEGKTEDDVVPLWIFLKMLSDAESEALLSGIEISPDQSEMDYYDALMWPSRRSFTNTMTE